MFKSLICLAPLAATAQALFTEYQPRNQHNQDDSQMPPQQQQPPPPIGGGDPYDGSQGVPNRVFSSSWVGSPSNPQIIPPSQDHFYTVNTTLVNTQPNGKVLLERSMGINGLYSGIEEAIQMVYSTKDNYDGATSSVADVLIPRKDKLNGRIMAVALPEDSVCLDCAPSYNIFFRRSSPVIQSLLDEGYIVVIPDYEGVRGSYTVGHVSGTHILDALSATKDRVQELGIKGQFDVGIWGYGTAALASGWAAEMATDYAPHLDLKAAALGSVMANLTNWLISSNGSPSSYLVATSLLGMATEYKSVFVALEDNLSPRRKKSFNSAANHCATDNTLRFLESDVLRGSFQNGYNIIADPNVRAVYDLNSLGKNAPKCNMFVYQGSQDSTTVLHDVRSLLKYYCSQGTTVKYHEIPDTTHAQGMDMYLDVIDFFDDAFANKVTSSCERIDGNFYQN